MHLTKKIHPQRRVLSVFSLVMINIIAVDSLRSLAISAEYGLSLIFYYVVGALFFFIPTALVAAELATGWPKIGGLYVWVRVAFGPRWGLVAIWLQWIYNVVWYPTILAFIAGTLAYLIDPSLANDKIYLVSVVLIGFWGATIANCFGMKIASIVSTLGAIFGTLLPMALITVLGAVWLLTGNTPQIEVSAQALLPDLSSINNLAFFVAVLFSLLGIEMSAVHAEDVQNPQRDYPKAIVYSGILIVTSLICASLAIAIVVPKSEISLISGLLDAFHAFFNHFNMPWMTKIIAVLIVLGSLSSVATWILGPAKGLLAAAEDGCLPAIFQYTNRYKAPVVILMMQGLIFTPLCLLFLFMPSVNSSYWVLSALTGQLAMFVYLFMFAAVIRLRYSQPDTPRAYRVPGGIVGVWATGIIGSIAALFALAVGFLPPTDIVIHSLWVYEAILIGGIVLFCGIPLLIYQAEKKLA